MIITTVMLTGTGQTGISSSRAAYCISRPTSSPMRLSTEDLQHLHQTVRPDFARSLDNVGLSYGSLKATYRCGSAEVPAQGWRENEPSGDAEVLQPLDWLSDVIAGTTDAIVLDGICALSTNPAIILPVLARRGGCRTQCGKPSVSRRRFCRGRRL